MLWKRWIKEEEIKYDIMKTQYMSHFNKQNMIQNNTK